MKAIVIYKSNTGFTKKYAEWIAEALSCSAVSVENAKTIKLSEYDTLVFGGWFFAGSLKGLKEMKEKLIAFNGKKILFATGSRPAQDPGAMQALNACLTQEERKTISTFYMQGGLDYTRMGLVHKMMMKMMSSMLKKQKGVDSAEYKVISQSFDATDKTAIQPLINEIMDSAKNS